MGAPSPSDPNLLFFFACDENGVAAKCANRGSLSAVDYLYPDDDDGLGQLPRVDDPSGGRALDLRQAPGGTWVSSRRWARYPETPSGTVEDAEATWLDWFADNPVDADTVWTMGCRFYWKDLVTGNTGGADHHWLFSVGACGDSPYVNIFSLWIRPDSGTTPATGGRFRTGFWKSYVTHTPGVSGCSDVIGNWPENGIEGNTWYRVVVQITRNATTPTHYDVHIWLRNLDTGTLYHIKTENEVPGSDSLAWWRAQENPWMGFGLPGAETDHRSHEGYIDEGWFYVGALGSGDIEDALREGISVPWVEPDYRVADHVIWSALTHENGDFPRARVLPTGGTRPRHPVNVLCQAIRTRVEGWRPGRPWCLRSVDFILDPAGPYGSHRARQSRLENIVRGLVRKPGRVESGAAEDAVDVVWTAYGPRRRRGFRIRRSVDSTYDTGANAFWTFRDYDDELHWLYKVGTALYAETGGGASSVSTGWDSGETPVGIPFDGRLVVLSPSARIIWDGDVSSSDAFTVAPPASCGVSAGAGGTLDGDYYYAATFYDPVSGDETGPTVSTQVSPSTQKVTVSLPAAAPDARFTKYRIYRTDDGGAAPNLFFLKEIDVAASWDDTGADSLTTETVDHVADSSGTFLGYLTAEPPDTFSLGCVHLNRLVLSGGSTYPERVYIGEPNEPLRWYSGNWFAADGPVKAVASWQGRLVVFTDNTVEIVESDFIRDADGNMNLARYVASFEVGCFGPNAVESREGQLWWADRRGIYTMQGTNPVPVAGDIEDLFPYVNTNLRARICLAWNHLTRSLWVTLPCSATQDDSTRFQTQFVMDMDQPGRWTRFGLEASFVGQFDDDSAGIRFGLIDHLGVFKEAESYEGDGAEGDEAWTSEDEGTDDYGTSPAGFVGISGRTFTAYGTPGWTVNALRGVHVVCRDRSTGDRFRYLIVSNTADTFTVERDPDADLAQGDGYYIGGIDARVDFAAHDFGSPNRKVVRQVQYQFADFTTGLWL